MNPFRRHGVLMLAIGWVLIIGILWWVVDEWGKREANPNRVLVTGAAGEVVLQRNRAGHFLADGEVNGRRVTFLLDTGATYIAIPAHLARELRLKLGPPITLQTAAGAVTAIRRASRVCAWPASRCMTWLQSSRKVSKVRCCWA